jgi:hypothetical protein
MSFHQQVRAALEREREAELRPASSWTAREALEDIATELDLRAEDLFSRAKDETYAVDRARLFGKAFAYRHCAELLRTHPAYTLEAADGE